LRAVVPTVAKSWTRKDSDFSDVDLYFKEFALIAHSASRRHCFSIRDRPARAHSLN
jgi:hypothetical protein